MNAPENETRILITGANSFIGRHLIAHLLSETAGRPIRITAAVLPEQAAELSKPHSELQSSAGWSGATLLPQTQLAFADNDFAPGIPSVETAAQTLLPENERSASGEEAFPYAVLLEVAGADFTDPDSVTELIQRTRPTQIYHLSTNSAQEAERNSGVDAGRIFAADVQTTRNLLEAASRLSPFPRVLLAGEGCVYGSVAPERPAREEDPIGPLWRYGGYVDSRIEIETVAKAYRALAIMARTFTTVGPAQSSQCTISGYVRQLARIKLGLEQPQLTVSSLEVQRDVLDVRDVVRAYRLLMAQGECGEAYNVSTGKPVSMRTILERLCLISGGAVSFIQDSVQDRECSLPAEIACSTGDTLRTWAAIGWQARRTLDETLNDLFVYWLQIEKLQRE